MAGRKIISAETKTMDRRCSTPRSNWLKWKLSQKKKKILWQEFQLFMILHNLQLSMEFPIYLKEDSDSESKRFYFHAVTLILSQSMKY